MEKKLIFDPHAGRQLKGRKIPRDVARTIAMYGHTVKTERIGNWVTRIIRGTYKGKPVHVIVSGRVIKTAYYADEWDCKLKVFVKRHPGVTVNA